MRKLNIPHTLGLAVAIRLLKAGDSTLCDNYRPISLLNVKSTVNKKLVYYRLCDILSNKMLINNKQFGFRKRYSSESASHSVVADVYKRFNEEG